jgi:hypothetical protein
VVGGVPRQEHDLIGKPFGPQPMENVDAARRSVAEIDVEDGQRAGERLLALLFELAERCGDDTGGELRVFEDIPHRVEEIPIIVDE